MARMRCVFINLDRAAERRSAVEASFAASAPDGWRLERLPAVAAAETASVPGTRSSAEKGCHFSHLAALRIVAGSSEPTLIVEDDVEFSPHAFTSAPAALAKAAGLDMLFCNVSIGNPYNWPLFRKERDRLTAAGEFRTIDLKPLHFGGSCAYFVTPASARKLLGILEALPAVDEPYDVLLAQLLAADRISAAAIFPFVVGLTDHAWQSQIGNGGRLIDGVSWVFRRLMFVTRDPAMSESVIAWIKEPLRSDPRLSEAVAGALVA